MQPTWMPNLVTPVRHVFQGRKTCGAWAAPAPGWKAQAEQVGENLKAAWKSWPKAWHAKNKASPQKPEYSNFWRWGCQMLHKHAIWLCRNMCPAAWCSVLLTVLSRKPFHKISRKINRFVNLAPNKGKREGENTAKMIGLDTPLSCEPCHRHVKHATLCQMSLQPLVILSQHFFRALSRTKCKDSWLNEKMHVDLQPVSVEFVTKKCRSNQEHKF